MFYRLLAAFIALYAYACLRIWQRVFAVIAIIPVWVYALVCASLLAVFLIARLWLTIPPRLGRYFNIWSGYWLAFSFYFIQTTLAVDVFALLNWIIRVVDVTPRLNLIIGYCILAIPCLFVIVGAWNAHHTKIKKYSIRLMGRNQQAQPYNIVMVSDIHLGEMYDLADMKNMVARINALSPDLVLFAGDLIDNPHAALALYREEDIAQAFGNLQARHGVFAVLGNHDSFEEGDITRALFADTPVRILRDETVVIDDCFVIVGRKDACMHERTEIGDMIKDNKLPSIVVDHRPILLEQSREAGASLLLCGHTHAGQLFPFTLVAKALFEVYYGYARRGDMHIVVSSGYGACILPVRIGSHSEIVQMDVLI